MDADQDSDGEFYDCVEDVDGMYFLFLTILYIDNLFIIYMYTLSVYLAPSPMPIC